MAKNGCIFFPTHRRPELLHSLVVVFANGSHGFERLRVHPGQVGAGQRTLDAREVLAHPPGKTGTNKQKINELCQYSRFKSLF